jgi:hypothetical protein
VKGIKLANPPPSLLVSDFRLGGHTSKITSPHRRGGGKSRRYRRLVTYEQADESRGGFHIIIRRLAVPPTCSGSAVV